LATDLFREELYPKIQLPRLIALSENIVIRASGICKSFGDNLVLNDISFHAKKGGVHGIVGANGTGKSTFFKILLDLLDADAGTIQMQKDHPKPIGGIIEKPSLYGYLSAAENVMLFARMQGISLTDAAIDDKLIEVGLSPDRKDAVRNYSMGMKQRLGIAVAMLNSPNLLILDEPFSGLDPIGIENLKRLLLKLTKENGVTLLVSSHILAHLFEISDELYLIRNKKLEPYEAAAPTGYTLIADNIADASSLLPEGSEVYMQRAVVAVSAKELPELLGKLLEAGIHIRACIPMVNAQNWTEG